MWPSDALCDSSTINIDSKTNKKKKKLEMRFFVGDVILYGNLSEVM